MSDADDFLIDAILDPDATRDSFEGEYNKDGTRKAIGGIPPMTVRRESKTLEFRRLLREDAAIEQIGDLPPEGGELVMILNGKFHGFDLIAALLRMAAQPAKIVRIGTMSINKTHVDLLCQTADAGTIRDMAMVVSAVFAEKDRDLWNYTLAEFANRGFRAQANRNHTKVITAELTDGRKYTIHGSLNMRRCHAYEQVHLVRCPALHDFYAEFLDTALTITT